MNELKEAVETKSGQPWKVEKQFDDFSSADVARKNVLADSRDGLQAKIKFLPSLNKFVLKTRAPVEVQNDLQKSKGKKVKNSNHFTGT